MSMSFFTNIFRIIAILGALALPLLASADGGATLSFTQPPTVSAGKTFVLSVVVDSVQGFNSANAQISFDPTLLSVTNISKSDSAFSLWAVEPKSDNAKGTVTFEGGNTVPLTGKNTILAITFKALKTGSATVSYDSGSVLAADGKGTDILGTKTPATFDIGEGGTDPPPPPPPPVTPAGPLPDLPDITSSTHPNSDAYSNAPTAKFSWDLPADVTVDRMTLDTKPTTVPTTSYDPAVSEKEFDKLTDGVMYFHLRYQNDSGWGPTAHMKIMVDITPPDMPSLTANVDGTSTDVTLKFNATDTLSGLDRYEIAIDGGNPSKVPPSSVPAGQYVLSDQSPGDHTVKVTAFDKAGNTASQEANFTIKGEAAPAAGAAAAGEDTPKPTDWRLIADIILVALIAFLIGYLWYERNAFRHEKYLAKREADELRDNMGNIFAAMREEIGEQTGYLFQKPNPSPQDREVMGTINEAIDLSEELLSKEVEDVRKLLM